MIIATFTRFLGAPIEFDTLVAVLAGWTAGAAAIVALGAPSRRPTGGPSPPAWRPSVCRCPGWSRPASTRAAPRRTSPRAETARRCSSRRSAPTSAAPICSSGSTAASSLAISATSGRSRRCGGPWSTRHWSRSRPATSAFAPRESSRSPPPSRMAYVLAYEAIAGRSLDRLEPAELTDEVLAARLGAVRAAAYAPRRPSRSAAGQCVPRR